MAADLRLRPRAHRDRPSSNMTFIKKAVQTQILRWIDIVCKVSFERDVFTACTVQNNVNSQAVTRLRCKSADTTDLVRDTQRVIRHVNGDVLGGGTVLAVCEHKFPTAAEPHRRAERNVGSGLETQWATFCDLSSVCHVDRGRCHCSAWSNGSCM